MAHKHVQIFLSTVTAEFGSYRERLRHDLTRSNVSVAVQEDFVASGHETLIKLDDCIAHCDAVVHLVGDMTGAPAQPPSLAALLQRHSDLATRLPALAPCIEPGAPALAYTQWEAWLALLHRKPLIIAVPEAAAPRDANHVREPTQQAAQQAHLARLAAFERFPEIRFANADRLAVAVLASHLQDILALAGPARSISNPAAGQHRRAVQRA